MAMVYKDNYLCHYGVLGMRWGVRRDLRKARRQQRKVEKAKAVIARDMTRRKLSSPATKPRTINDLSDDELKKVVNRLDLEKRYRDLTPKQETSGAKMVAKILATGATIATAAATAEKIYTSINKIKKTKVAAQRAAQKVAG